MPEGRLNSGAAGLLPARKSPVGSYTWTIDQPQRGRRSSSSLLAGGFLRLELLGIQENTFDEIEVSSQNPLFRGT